MYNAEHVLYFGEFEKKKYDFQMISRLHCSSHSIEQESSDRYWAYILYALQRSKLFIERDFSENVFGSPRLNYLFVKKNTRGLFSIVNHVDGSIEG